MTLCRKLTQPRLHGKKDFEPRLGSYIVKLKRLDLLDTELPI